MLSMEGRRTRYAGAVDFREPIYGYRASSLLWHFSQGSPPCNPAAPFEKKGSIRKLFLWTGDIFLTERQRIRDAETVDFREPIYGYRAPSPLWCFVLSCMVGGILRKPLGFRRCLPPARPEKAWPFQAGRSPCTKRPQTVRLGLYAPKKFLRVPRGVFSKTLLGREWDGVPQRVRKPVWPGTPFQAGRSPFTKHPRLSGFTFTNLKKFLGVPKGVFSKTLLGRVWDRVPQKGRESQLSGVPLFRRDKVLSRNAHSPSGFAFTHRKKFLGVPRGVFSKTLPWQGGGTASHKRRASQPIGARLFRRDEFPARNTPDCPAWPSQT